MTPRLHVFRDPPLDGPTNMARDEHLLRSDDLRPAALRLYAWDPPTISLGYFQRVADVARLPADVRDLPVVRRTTGGGAILHDLELTYALAVDESLPIGRAAPTALYALVHELWRDVLAADDVASELAPDTLPLPSPRSGPFFCFETPGRTDLIVGSDKLLGSAQRRIPGRVLQHGSLLLGRRFASHPGHDLGRPAAERVSVWVDRLVAGLGRTLELAPHFAEWDERRLADVAVHRTRYASDEWTRRR